MNVYDDIYFAQTGRALGGRYRVTKLLGEGAFGKVFKADYVIFDIKLRSVALKLFTKECYVTAANAPKVFSEALLLEALAAEARANGEQVHLVTVYDIGVFDDYQHAPYVAMEFVNGGSLEDRLEKAQHFSLAETITYGRAICAGLRLAHEAKPPIIHRDLKPANVLITRNGFLKVSDFGVAVDQREALLEGGGGTITYAPPELSSGAPATPAYDIYALGVTMLEFLRGRNPLNEVSARAREQGAATAARKGLGKPEKGTPYIEQYVGLEIERAKEKLARLEDPETGQPLVEQCAELKLAKRVQEALRRCLAIHPEDRYAGASELDQDLAACQTPAGQINRRVVTAQREAQNTLDAARQHLEWDDAEETARELLDLLKREPRNAEALFLLATVYEKQGKLEEACRRQKEGSEIKETSASLRRLAELYQAAGKQAKANTTLLRAELKETTEQ